MRAHQLYTRVGGTIVFSSSVILISVYSSHKFGLGKPQSECIVVSIVVLYILRHTLLTCVISYPYSDSKQYYSLDNKSVFTWPKVWVFF